MDIDTYNGWRYNSCTKCKRKMKVYEKKLAYEACVRTEDYLDAR
jgi:hypothetical protein